MSFIKIQTMLNKDSAVTINTNHVTHTVVVLSGILQKDFEIYFVSGASVNFTCEVNKTCSKDKYYYPVEKETIDFLIKTFS